MRDRQSLGSGDSSGRDAKSLPEDLAEVVRAGEAALLCDVLHGVFAGLYKTHGHDQAQVAKVLARRDPASLSEATGKVKTAQLRHLRHVRDPDGASVVFPTKVLDPIDERGLGVSSGPSLIG